MNPTEQARAIADLAAAQARARRMCNRCLGVGEIRHPEDRDLNGNHPDLRFIDCPRCGGTGRQ